MSSAPSPMLEIRGLNLQVGTRPLIRDLDLQIRPGEVWCLLGANGVGKTLLLHTLAGLRKIDDGTIALAGRPLAGLAPIDAARLRAFLPQSIHDAFSASALDIALMGRHPYLGRWAWEDDADRILAHAALAAVGVADLVARDVTTLSGGERQRVAIAALLVQDTPLMLLDEPVAHLDLHHQILVLRHLMSLARDRGKALLYSIHDLNLAARFSTHALLFCEDGRLEHGPVGEVMNDEALSLAFRHPLCQMKVGEQLHFFPA